MAASNRPPDPPALGRPEGLPSRVWLGLSGGLDSTVLLHRLAGSLGQGLQVGVLHVNHGLQAVAADFEACCQQACDQLGLPLTILRVQVTPEAIASLGLEAAARQARYQAYVQQAGGADQALVLAHQLNDQVETSLLQWVRGAGLDGLCAMQAWSQRLVDGQLLQIWRPLLHESRASLEQEAHALGLRWVEDPSNQDLSLDRNRIRQSVLPVLTELRAGALSAMGRSIDQLQSARALLDEQTQADLNHCLAPDQQLRAQALRSLSDPRRQQVIRAWLRMQGLALPPSRRLAEFSRQLAETREGHEGQPGQRCELQMRPTQFGDWPAFRVFLRASLVQTEPLKD